MGITRTAEQVEAFRKAAIQKLANRVVKGIKAGGCRVGEVSVDLVSGVYSLTVENNCGYKRTIDDFIKPDDPMTLVTEEYFEGQYLWDADHYIKPSNFATFKF